MKSIATFAICCLASAASVVAQTKSTVVLRVRVTDTPQFAVGAQVPLSEGGRTIPVAIGTQVSFDNTPLSAESIEIESISEGAGHSGRHIAENDENVICQAMTKHSSRGPRFSIGKVQTLDERGTALTGLRCGYGKDMI